jgi:hypothetical protein
MYILMKYGVRVWTEFSWLGVGLLADHSEGDVKPSGSITRVEFVDLLYNYQCFKKDLLRLVTYKI